MSILEEPLVSSDVTDTIAYVGARRRNRASPGVLLAVGWLSLIVLLALLAPVLPIARYFAIIGVPRQAPGIRFPEFLGTDYLGRSELSRIIYGSRESLLVGILSVCLGMVLGGLIDVSRPS